MKIKKQIRWKRQWWESQTKTPSTSGTKITPCDLEPTENEHKEGQKKRQSRWADTPDPGPRPNLHAPKSDLVKHKHHLQWLIAELDGDHSLAYDIFEETYIKLLAKKAEYPDALFGKMLEDRVVYHYRAKTKARDRIRDNDGGYVDLDEKIVASINDKRRYSRDPVHLTYEYKHKNPPKCICRARGCGEPYPEPYHCPICDESIISTCKICHVELKHPNLMRHYAQDL